MNDFFYIPPTGILYQAILLAALSLVALLELLALIRVPRIAGQRAWRQWFAVLPGLIGAASLAFTGIEFFVYFRVVNDPSYVPDAFHCFSNGQCNLIADPNVQQAIPLLQFVDRYEILVLYAIYGVVIYGFIVLSAGRRRKVA